VRNALRAAIVFAVIAVVAVTSVVVGNAAQLQVDGGQLSVASASHPCAGYSLAVTADPVPGSTSTVRVTMPAAWPSTCVGKRIDVAVSDGTPTGTRTGTITAAPAASTAATVALNGAFTPASTGITTSAVVAGWSLATSWSYVPPSTGPVVPGNPVTVVRSTSWNISNHDQACVTVDVSTTTTGQSLWRVDLVVAEPPFYGATSGYTITGGQVELVGPGVAVNGRLGIQGKNNGWDTLSSSQVRQFTVCHYNLPTPPNLPSAYTTSVAQGLIWTDTQACLTTTVTGNGTSNFYFGWQAAVDMSSAYQRIESTGRVVRRVQQDFSSNIATISPAPTRATSAYTITTGWQGVLRLNETRALTVCAYEY